MPDVERIDESSSSVTIDDKEQGVDTTSKVQKKSSVGSVIIYIFTVIFLIYFVFLFVNQIKKGIFYV